MKTSTATKPTRRTFTVLTLSEVVTKYFAPLTRTGHVLVATVELDEIVAMVLPNLRRWDWPAPGAKTEREERQRIVVSAEELMRRSIRAAVEQGLRALDYEPVVDVGVWDDGSNEGFTVGIQGCWSATLATATAEAKKAVAELKAKKKTTPKRRRKAPAKSSEPAPHEDLVEKVRALKENPKRQIRAIKAAEKK